MLSRLSNLLTIIFVMYTSPAKATTMHNAVKTNDLDQVKTLLKGPTGASLREFQDEVGRTPLLLATELNRIEIARALIEAGANVNAKDAKQDSPYLYAGAEGRLEILKLTLAHGADLKSTNRYGGTALIPAAEKGHIEAVKTLIAAGVNINHVNKLGWTALLEAVILSDGGKVHQEIVRLLIKGGANVNLADKDGVTPMEHAKRRGYTIMMEDLKKAGAK